MLCIIFAVLAVAVVRVNSLDDYLGVVLYSDKCTLSTNYRVCPGWMSFYKDERPGSHCEHINFMPKYLFLPDVKIVEKYWNTHEITYPCMEAGSSSLVDLETAKGAVEVRKRFVILYDQFVCYSSKYFPSAFSWVFTSSEDFAYQYCYTILKLLQSDTELQDVVYGTRMAGLRRWVKGRK